MTVEAAPAAISAKRAAGLFACVVLLAGAPAWAFLSMRAVMGAGGSCGSGGPYEIARPSPDGAWLISVAIPMLMVTAMLGSAFAVGLSAPNLLLPMWGLLFGSLGWNFLEFGLFRGASRSAGSSAACCSSRWPSRCVLRAARPAQRPTPPGVPRLWWWLGCYAGLASIGFTLGAWTYALVS